MNEKLELIRRGTELKKFMDDNFVLIRKKTGLKKIEIEVLTCLYTMEDCTTPSEIARRMQLNRGHVSQAIDTLYRRNYLVSVPDEDDRRCIHYFLTDEAKEVSAEISARYDELEDIMTAGLSEKELTQFLATYEKILSNINRS